MLYYYSFLPLLPEQFQMLLLCQDLFGGSVTKSCPTLVTPLTAAHQAPLSAGFPRQEYWSGVPFPPPGNLPDPGIEPRSPTLQAVSSTACRFFLTKPPGKPSGRIYSLLFLCLIYSCFIRTWFRQHLLQKVHSALIVWLALLPQAPKFPRHTCQ